MSLSKLPRAFGLTELKKGYFPHLFNGVQNQNYVGPYPDAKFYSPEFMTAENHDIFFNWYADKQETIFDFKQEMLDYCRSDVDILRRAYEISRFIN